MRGWIALLAGLAMTGCSSLSSYQEAKVLDPGNAAVTFGITQFQDDLVRDQLFDSSAGHRHSLMEIGARAGVFPHIDLGFRYTIPGAAVFDAKYQFMGSDTDAAIQMSGGLKIGYSDFQVGPDSNRTDIAVYDWILPFYATYAPQSWLGFTLSPEAAYRHSENEFEYPSGFIIGGNADVRIGKSIGVLAEMGCHRNLDQEYNLINYGLSVYFPIDNPLQMWGF
jgi:hypothetical protein